MPGRVAIEGTGQCVFLPVNSVSYRDPANQGWDRPDQRLKLMPGRESQPTRT
jgi:hypothetical protein